MTMPIGDRVYTTRTGVRIGSAYTKPNFTNPYSIYTMRHTNPDTIVIVGCAVAALALAVIMTVWG